LKCNVISTKLPGVTLSMNVPENIIAQGFPTFEPALVTEINEVAELRHYKEGETLMRTGQYIRSTLLIVEGLVKIYREDDEGNEFFMYYLDAGNACALSMVCATRQETSEIMAKAVADTTVLAIPLKNMDEWMTKYKSWYHFVLGSYRDRFEELLQTIDHIAFRNMDERLVFYLKRHQDKLKSNNLNLSMTEIAQELNSSREVISRLMKKLSEKGLIRLHRSFIEIIDLDHALA
jgi:CRP/FNR family transcriptional regulator, anaerobic regulatory protein